MRKTGSLTRELLDLPALPEGAAIAAALDCLPHGVILVEADARVAFINACGKEILARPRGLHLQEGRLSASATTESEALWRLIAEVAASTARPRGDGSTALAVSRPHPMRPLSVIVSPLRHRPASAKAPQPLAAVFVGDPERDLDTAEDELMRLYDLTPAEAHVALALLEGKGLDWAAEQVSLGVNTARTHLKRIFGKTRTHRQAELVRLILRGPAVRRDRGGRKR